MSAAANRECSVCREESIPQSDLSSVSGCAHYLCKGCWALFLKTRVEQKYTMLHDGKLTCPEPGCKQTISMDFAKAHAGPSTIALINAAQSTIPDASKSFESLTLEDFNYHYNANGELRHKQTQGKFIFVNQSHYELLGDVITNDIQRWLKSKYGLIELKLPFSHHGAGTNVTNFLPSAPVAAAATATAAAPAHAAAATTTAAAAASAAMSDGATSKDAKEKVADSAAAVPAASASGGAAAAAAAAPTAASSSGAAEPALVNDIFASPDAMYNDTLLILIQGSGAVRAGMWARACCINESLAIGTIFPYLEKAKQMGWAVVVLNPNLNRIKKTPAQVTEWKANRLKERAAHKTKTGKDLPPDDEKSWPYQLASQWNPIPEHDTPRAHTLYSWDRVISASKAKHMLVVAHSAGGACTMALLQQRTKDVLSRVRAVAFTDSVHSVPDDATRPVKSFMRAHCINYVTSDDPLDTPVTDRYDDSDGCPCVSAGHPKHEFTSGTAFPSVFKFLDKHLQSAKTK